MQARCHLILDWENIQVNQDFKSSDTVYAVFGKLPWHILAAAEEIHHILLSPSLSDTLEDILQCHRTSHLTWLSLGLLIQPQPHFWCCATSNGIQGCEWRLRSRRIRVKREKIKAYMIAVFWESVEDHVRAMATEEIMVCLLIRSEVDGKFCPCTWKLL